VDGSTWRRQPALVFVHLPKTGGTSLTAAIGRNFPEDSKFTDDSSISIDLLDQLGDLLDSPIFIHGHPEHGVIDKLCRAYLVTVLRLPESQAISNYLHVRRNPEVPLYAAARQMSFSEFMRENWQYLVFQCIALDVAQSVTPIGTPETFFRRLPAIRALLDSFDFVGCLENMRGLLGHLTSAFGWNGSQPPVHLNAAPPSDLDCDLIGLRDAYRDLSRDPYLAPLIAAEQSVYLQAQRRGALGRRQSNPR
jgi:hypothetical protein